MTAAVHGDDVWDPRPERGKHHQWGHECVIALAVDDVSLALPNHLGERGREIVIAVGRPRPNPQNAHSSLTRVALECPAPNSCRDRDLGAALGYTPGNFVCMDLASAPIARIARSRTQNS